MTGVFLIHPQGAPRSERLRKLLHPLCPWATEVGVWGKILPEISRAETRVQTREEDPGWPSQSAS